MWWLRRELITSKTGTKKFAVATKYKNAGQARIQQAKVLNGDTGELKEEFEPDIPELPGALVGYTKNNSDDIEPVPEWSIKEDLAGEYKVYVINDTVALHTVALHPESYTTLARANQIVKKYLRNHYQICLVMYQKREQL